MHISDLALRVGISVHRLHRIETGRVKGTQAVVERIEAALREIEAERNAGPKDVG